MKKKMIFLRLLWHKLHLRNFNAKNLSSFHGITEVKITMIDLINPTKSCSITAQNKWRIKYIYLLWFHSVFKWSKNLKGFMVFKTYPLYFRQELNCSCFSKRLNVLHLLRNEWTRLSCGIPWRFRGFFFQYSIEYLWPNLTTYTYSDVNRLLR